MRGPGGKRACNRWRQRVNRVETSNITSPDSQKRIANDIAMLQCQDIRYGQG